MAFDTRRALREMQGSRVQTLVGVIPAGGKGSRLAPFPGPKELLPLGWQSCVVNGEVQRRPKVVSQYVLEGMVGAGAGQILMIIGEHKYDLLRYYGSGQRFGTCISYLYQEQAQGMVHAIDIAYPWARGKRILFGMPDTIMHPDDVFYRLLVEHETRAADLTLGLFTTDRPEQFGMVTVDRAGRIKAHADKPRNSAFHLMWGCAVWEPEFTEIIHSVASSKVSGRKSELVLGDVIDEALRSRMHLAGYEFAGGFYIDVGTYDGLIEAQARIAELQAMPSISQPAEYTTVREMPEAAATLVTEDR